ncbi:hypothetical protein TNCV_4429861 [Trichonephila clavipes]|nr:hypothetical protein TNCV_4429861 [Trichonephila clavipes]
MIQEWWAFDPGPPLGKLLCALLIEADFVVESKTNNAALVPTSSEARNVMKSMFSYLDAHSNGEMNNKTDHIEQAI